MPPTLNSIKAQQFLGYGRIELRHLNFKHDNFRSQHRAIDAVKVQRIYDIFRLEGCDRGEEEHCISAIINTDEVATSVLDELRQCREVGQARSLLSSRVDCLHGAHRIEAAKRFLDRNDQWWPCRLFATGLSSEAVQHVIEAYRNEQPYTDGEIFLKILQRRKQGESAKEKKWWARLSPTKRKDLRQLLRNASFANAFSDLTRFPGLFARINLGTHRISGLKCDEEILQYLYLVQSTWTAIVTTEYGTTGKCVDAVTVKHLELLAPGLFEGDALQAKQAIGDCFAEVSEPERKALLANVLAQTRLIPSLRTLLENLKFLEPCCQIMKRLLGDGQRRSIQMEFWASFFAPEQSTVETAEATYAVFDSSSQQQQRRIGYIMLWLNCLRNFPGLVNATPRKIPGKAKPTMQQENPALWQRLAGLAISQGFLTEPASILNARDPDLSLAEGFLAAAVSNFDPQHAQEVASVLKSVRRPERTTEKPQFSSETPLPPEHRCGRPFEDDHASDRTWLFLPWLLHDVTPGGYPGKHPTTLFVKYSTLCAFFNLESVRIEVQSLRDERLIRPEPMVGVRNASHTCCGCVNRDNGNPADQANSAAIRGAKQLFKEEEKKLNAKIKELTDMLDARNRELEPFRSWQRQNESAALRGTQIDEDLLFESSDTDMYEDPRQLELEEKKQEINLAEGKINRLELDLETANTKAKNVQKRLDEAVKERDRFLKGLPRLLMFRKGQYSDAIERQSQSVLTNAMKEVMEHYRKLILLEDFPDVGIVPQVLVFPDNNYCYNALDEFFHQIELQNERQPDNNSRKFVFPFSMPILTHPKSGEEAVELQNGRPKVTLLKSTQKAAEIFQAHSVAVVGSRESIRKLQQNLLKREAGGDGSDIPVPPKRTKVGVVIVDDDEL